jgi:hypothetical protein
MTMPPLLCVLAAGSDVSPYCISELIGMLTSYELQGHKLDTVSCQRQDFCFPQFVQTCSGAHNPLSNGYRELFFWGSKAAGA